MTHFHSCSVGVQCDTVWETWESLRGVRAAVGDSHYMWAGLWPVVNTQEQPGQPTNRCSATMWQLFPIWWVFQISAVMGFSQRHWNQNKTLTDVKQHPKLVSHSTRPRDGSWSQHTLPSILVYIITSVPVMVRLETHWPSLRCTDTLYVSCLTLFMPFQKCSSIDIHMELSDLIQLSKPRGQVQASMMNFHSTMSLALRNLSRKFSCELFSLCH